MQELGDGDVVAEVFGLVVSEIGGTLVAGPQNFDGLGAILGCSKLVLIGDNVPTGDRVVVGAEVVQKLTGGSVGVAQVLVL